MDKKIYRRVNLVKALILFMVIVCVVLVNLIVYSNMKEENKITGENKTKVESGNTI